MGKETEKKREAKADAAPINFEEFDKFYQQQIKSQDPLLCIPLDEVAVSIQARENRTTVDPIPVCVIFPHDAGGAPFRGCWVWDAARLRGCADGELGGGAEP